MTEKQKKILKIAAVGVVAYLLITRFSRASYAGNSAGGWTEFADVAGGRINEGLGIINEGFSMFINDIPANARAKRQQSYDFLRDTKDNSKLFSNDMLIL